MASAIPFFVVCRPRATLRAAANGVKNCCRHLYLSRWGRRRWGRAVRHRLAHVTAAIPGMALCFGQPRTAKLQPTMTALGELPSAAIVQLRLNQLGERLQAQLDIGRRCLRQLPGNQIERTE